MTAKITHFKVGTQASDRTKLTRAFWAGLKLIGLSPGPVLRHSNLPSTVYGGETALTTVQRFALWRTIRELSQDASVGWKSMRELGSEQYHPTLLAALHARSYREALERHARYKQLCSLQEFRFIEKGAEFKIEPSWPFAGAERPPALLIDAVFALVLELGRRGTRTKIRPERVELARERECDDGLADYFGCAVKYRCARDALVLRVSDVELPFATHNEDLVAMLAPQFENQLKAGQAPQSTVGAVKWILRRLLSGSRPDIVVVARELGMSERTLQRRITEEGKTFRQLLNETRKELVEEYFRDDSVGITDAAFLLGFENTNSFYRAFRAWEGKTPAEWRALHRGRTKRNPHDPTTN